jgi:hypothetical protein
MENLDVAKLNSMNYLKSIFMLKQTAFFILFSVITNSAFSQDVKKEVQKVETKMDVFASKTGTIIKFIDTKLPELKLSYGSVAETRIRKILNGSEVRYFYQIENQGKYGSSTASIDFSDLIEVIKAIKSLKSEVENDLSLNPDYLENKFTTVDGFQVGYYVSKGKANWYLRLEKYGSDSIIFVKDGTSIESVFTDAKNRIEQLNK